MLTEGDSTWLYTGFCPIPMKARGGAQIAELAQDMLTVLRPAKTVVPSTAYAENTSFARHAWSAFEGFPRLRVQKEREMDDEKEGNLSFP